MIAWRIALLVLGEDALRWIVGTLATLFAALLLFALAGTIAVISQPFGQWWLVGVLGVGQFARPASITVSAQPGVVPDEAGQPFVGPVQGDATPLMAAIAPWLGTRYLFGGTTRAGVDCSAFVQAIFRQLGVSLPRTAQTQYAVTARVSQPAIGDLAFFRNTYSSPDFVTHVGVVVGDGVMVSAIEPVVSRQALNADFWRSHFVSFGRVRWPARPEQARDRAEAIAVRPLEGSL